MLSLPSPPWFAKTPSLRRTAVFAGFKTPCCCFAEDDKEIYKDLKRMCTAIFLSLNLLFGDVLDLDSLIGT